MAFDEKVAGLDKEVQGIDSSVTQITKVVQNPGVYRRPVKTLAVIPNQNLLPPGCDCASKSRKLAILFVINCFASILLAGTANYAPAEMGGLNLPALYGQWVIEELSKPRITLVETFKMNREFKCEIQLYYGGLKARRRFRGTWKAHSGNLTIDLISLPDAIRGRLNRLLIMRNVNIDGSCMRFQDRDGRLLMATKISDRVTND